MRFGEAAINLTAAGVFPSGTCEALGSAFPIKIHKVTENGDGTFGYTTTVGLSPSTFNLSNGQTRTYGPDTVLPGNYTVKESTLPSGWTLKDLQCTATGNGTSVSPSLATATASITMAPEGLVECTYTNHTNVSPTISTSLSDSSVSVGAGDVDNVGTTSACGVENFTITNK